MGLGIVLAALLISSLRNTRHHLEEHALREAKSLAETYALQIGRTIGELDHVTALLKNNWERSNGTWRLEEINKEDKFVDTTLAAISLINRDGIIVSSTLPGAAGTSVKDRSYFTFHQANQTRELHIGPPVSGRFEDKEIVTFTRRPLWPQYR
ncbi:hypothetical protein ASE07_05105 [Noviherbaspirillum sp. Root189]|nr:hypothetical protein ASE07_05105 [Noviherbaspirillum sp. Root189]